METRRPTPRRAATKCKRQLPRATLQLTAKGRARVGNAGIGNKQVALRAEPQHARCHGELRNLPPNSANKERGGPHCECT
eukprot:4246972-Alexandrium_andersonii.AAC.1